MQPDQVHLFSQKKPAVQLFCRRCLPILFLGVLLGCGRAPLPLAEDPRVQGAQIWMAPDLEATCAQLSGDVARDQARLGLMEGLEGEPQWFEDRWLLGLRRDVAAPNGLGRHSQSLLLTMGNAAQRPEVKVLEAADSVKVLARLGHGKGTRLLVESRQVRTPQEDWRRLVQLDLQGGARALAQGPVDKLHLEGQLLLVASAEAPGFVESATSWHLEKAQPLMQLEEGWRLGKSTDYDSPYRALVDFLQAVRKGHWKEAESRCDLRRLLALPSGGHGRNLKASMKVGFPELLDPHALLQAPPRGPIHHLKDAQGRVGWRVEVQEAVTPKGGKRWLLTRLERVLAPS